MAQQKPSISSFLPDDCIPKATSTQIDVQSRCSIPRDADAEYKRIATKSKIPSNSGHSIDTASKNEEDQLVMRRKGMATRWAILMFVSVTLGFDEYCLSSPASLSSQFEDWMHEDSGNSYQTHFNLLFISNSLPNLLIPLFGGVFVSQYGPWQAMIMFSTLIFVGQFTFAIGVHSECWSAMYLGRFVFGLGGENIYTTRSVLITRWFPDNQMTFAFGIGSFCVRFGSVFADSLPPRLADLFGLPAAIYSGVVVSAAILLSSLCVAYIEIGYEKELHIRKVELQPNNTFHKEAILGDQCHRDQYSNDSNFSTFTTRCTDSFESEGESLQEKTVPGLGGVVHLNMLFWLLAITTLSGFGAVYPFNIVASGILMERNYFRKPPSACQLLFPNQCTSGLLEPLTGNPSFDHITGGQCPGSSYAPILPSSLHITTGNTQWDTEWKSDEYVFDSLKASDINCVDSFWADACTRNYCERKNEASEKAGVIMSLPFLLGAFCPPLIGALCDKYGYRLMLIVISFVLTLGAQSFLALDQGPPLIPFLAQGVGSSIFGCIIWPTVAFTVDTQYLGLTNGILLCMMNMSISFYPMVTAALYNARNSFLPDVEIFFAANGMFGLVLSLYILYLDYKTGSNLNQPAHAIVVQTDNNNDDESLLSEVTESVLNDEGLHELSLLLETDMVVSSKVTCIQKPRYGSLN